MAVCATLQVWLLDETDGYVLSKIVEEMPGGSLKVLRQKVDATGHYSDEGTAVVTVAPR